MCAVCHQPIQGPSLADADLGLAYHPACALEQLPADALAALAGLLAAVAVPLILLWAA